MARYFAVSFVAFCFCALLYKLAVDQCVSHRGERWSDIHLPLPQSICSSIRDSDERAWAEKMEAQRHRQGDASAPVSYGVKGSLDLLFGRPTRFFAELTSPLFFFVLGAALAAFALIPTLIWKAIADVRNMTEQARSVEETDRPTVLHPDRRGPRRDTASIKLIRGEHDPRHRPKE